MLGRRQARTVAALALVLALAGTTACSTNRDVTEPPPEKVTDKLLAASVLTADDLGDGFTTSKAKAPINTELLDGTKCDDALTKVAPKADASASFQNGDGTVVTNQIAYLPGGGAGNLDSVINDIYDDCSKVVIEAKGESIRTLPLHFGALTDDTKAMKLEIETDDAPIQEHDYILIRRGDLVSVVRVEGTRPLDTQVTDRAVRQAIGNLSTLHNET